MRSSRKRFAQAMLLLAFLLLAAPNAALAQDGDNPTLHYFGAAIGAGIAVIGAGIGISPQAVKDIVGAFQLPLFLLEGVAVIALGVSFVVIFMR